MSNILYEKLRELGIPDPPEEVTETRVVRWGHNKRYWAVKFTGGYAIGDWVSNLREFAFEEGFSYNKCRQQIAEAQRKLTKKRNDDNTEAATMAQQLWRNASDCTTHPYLETKKIKGHGLKIDRQTLLIPLHDEQGNLTSLQKIWPNPQIPGKFIKGFLKGSRIQGNYFTIGEIKDKVVICEGYATGATIYEITGLPVVVAFSSNNLLNITHRVVENHPQTGVIIAADNDRFKDGNPGLTKAKEAAAAVKARLVVPEFTNDDDKLTDFNDLYLTEGPEKVRNAFLANEHNQQCVEETQKDSGYSCPVVVDTVSDSCPLNWTPPSNELQVFFYNQKNVRTAQTEGKTLWILKDICDALGLSNPTVVAEKLDDDEKVILKTKQNLVFKTNLNLVLDIPNRGLTAVTESGLYKVILQSRKLEARKFERWVTHDVLPQIREHGSYVTPVTKKTTLSPPEKAQYLTQIAGETAKNPCETEKNEETKEKEPPQNDEQEITDPHIPEGFQLTEDELLYYDESIKEYAIVSGRIEVVAHTEDHGSELTGKLVKFVTHSGETKQLRLHNNMIVKDGDAIHQILAGKGLFVSTRKRAKNKLSEYINASNPKQHAKIIKVSGWHENCYISENGIIGEQPKELLIFQPDSEPTAVGMKGNLQDWIENVGKMCIGNSRLILAVSAGFASILLKPCKRENFGLHFVGNSSEGKSTALYVAASVFGSRRYLRSWRSTDNGLEGIAATHNDRLLILDEMGAADSRKIGDISYMFNMGHGKTRANILGAARKTYSWRIGVLSSGEKDLETHMAESNKKMYAGQGLRLITVFAKATPESTGLLENLNGFQSYAALAQHLDEATREYYGTPMTAFVENAVKELDSLPKYFKDALREAKEKHLPSEAYGQDDRVFKFFFTLGFAGELATRYGITGWPVGEALTAAIEEFTRWIDHKGGYGNQEKKTLLYQLRCFFQKHQYSRFLLLDDYNELTQKIANEAIGYRKDTENGTVFYAYPERLKDALRKELVADINDVLKLTAGLGILERDKDDKHMAKVVTIAKKSKRMLVFNSKALADEEKNEERANESQK